MSWPAAWIYFNAYFEIRGIPSGYLSFVEQRLHETELVVLELLSAVYNSQTPIEPQRLSEEDRQSLARFGQKQSKAAKIEEWKTQPLRTDDQLHAWWLRKREMMSHPTHQSRDSVSMDAATPQDQWPDASPISVRYDDVSQHADLPVEQQDPSQIPVSDAEWQAGLDMSMPDGDNMFSNGSVITFQSTIPGPTGSSRSAVTNPPSSATNLNVTPLTSDRWRKYF